MGFCALVGDIADACASPKCAPDLHQGRTAAHLDETRELALGAGYERGMLPI